MFDRPEDGASSPLDHLDPRRPAGRPYVLGRFHHARLERSGYELELRLASRRAASAR